MDTQRDEGKLGFFNCQSVEREHIEEKDDVIAKAKAVLQNVGNPEKDREHIKNAAKLSDNSFKDKEQKEQQRDEL